ncbi:MAG TPA: hypothetical protein VMS30_04645 [Phycisphaerales bacterium]|jgi:hypothetical protein|nr:hypothetical protein [Phycisphaerales bacterium]
MARKKKRRGRRRGRPSALARLTVADLMREVERRRGMMSDLASQRDRLQSELDAINAEIADLESIGASAPMAPRRGPGRPRGSGGRAPHRMDGRRRGRGGNEQSLALALHKLLQGRTLGVAEMSDAVRKAGYRTKSPNFRTIVNAALLAKGNRGLFKKVSRGQYTAK